MTDGARRAVVAVMLAGIAVDAAVAPAAGTASPGARAALHLDDAAAGWSEIAFSTAYLCAIVASLWAAAVLGTRRYAAVSFLGFGAASLMCAFATRGDVFIAGRALEGLALGGVFATGLLTFAATAPKRDLTLDFAIFAFLALAVPNAAPLGAGIVAGLGTWRAVYVVLALASAAVGCAALATLRDAASPQRRRLDLTSASTLVVAAGAFEIFVERSGRGGADPAATLALLIAAIAGAAFVARELGGSPAPFVDLRVLGSGLVARGIAVALVLGMLIAGGEVQLQYARTALHLDPGHAAATLALRVAGIALGGILATVLAARGLPGRRLVVAGFATIALAFVAQGGITANAWGEPALRAVMLLHGLGFALVMGPLGSTLFAAVAPAEMPSLVVLFKLAVGLGDAVAAPVVAAFLALEAAAARVPAWAYADVFAAAAVLAVVAARAANALRPQPAASEAV